MLFGSLAFGLTMAAQIAGAVAAEISDQAGGEERDDTMIPCDGCDTMVRFCDYTQHMRECSSRLVGPILQVPSAGLVDSDEDSDGSEDLGGDGDGDDSGAEGASSPRAFFAGAGTGSSWAPAAFADAAARGRQHRPLLWDFAVPLELGGGEAPPPSAANVNVVQGDGLTRRIFEALMRTGRPAAVPGAQHQLASLVALTLPALRAGLDAAGSSILELAVPTDDYEVNTMLGELMGRVSVGVSDIERVSHRLVDAACGAICPICQEGLEEVSCRRTICGHDFCAACIEKWFGSSKKCPVCMCDVEDRAAAEVPVPAPVAAEPF